MRNIRGTISFSEFDIRYYCEKITGWVIILFEQDSEMGMSRCY